MAAQLDKINFLKELESLKARYGAELADLKAVRFVAKGDQGDALQFLDTPYFCRADDDGFIICVEERPV